VRLELAFLDGDEAVPVPNAHAADGSGPALTVLVVAAEADVRRYVRECLRERADVRVVEAATVAAAVEMAAMDAPRLLVVDEMEREVLVSLADVRAIVMVDDVPHGAPPPGSRRRLLARPFSADRLVAEVSELLS
jgi:hypothetical protein